MPDNTQLEVTSVAAPAAAPPVAPLPAAAVPQADQSLADVVADHQRMIQAAASRGTAPAAVVAPIAPSAAPASAAESPKVDKPTTPAPATPAPAEPAKLAEPTKPADKPPEERAKQLADFVRLQRQNRAESERLKADRAALAAEKTQVEASKAEVAAFNAEFAKDPVAAVEKRLGRSKFSTDFLLAALDRASKAEAEAAPTPEQRDEIMVKAAADKARAEIKAEQVAAEEKEAADVARSNAEGQARYFGQVDTFLRANETKFPNMAAEGWDTTEMVAAVEAHHTNTGQWPTAEQVLTHFETLHLERAEKYAKRLGFAKPAQAAPASAPLASSPAVAIVRSPVDARGKQDKPMIQGSIEEQRAEIVARLDGARTGA